MAIDPIAQLTEPLFHIGNLPQWTITRCAVTRAGAITCWSVDKHKGGVPATRFDPRTLPVVKVH